MRSFLACAALALALAVPVRAQVFGQYGGAVPVAVDHRLATAALGMSSNQLEFLGALRMSFYPGVDFGFQGGITRLGGGTGRTAVELGGDLKTAVAHRTDTFPLDLAVGGAIGVRSADGVNQLVVGPQALGSRTFTLAGGHTLVPYGGLGLLFARTEVGNLSTTDFSLSLRLGAEYAPMPDVRLLAELQLGANDALNDTAKLVLGANFPF